MSERNKQNKYEFEDCFLAYLDILGFKNRVKEAKSNFKEVVSLVEALKTMSEFEARYEKNTRTGKVEIRCSLFSDNIALMIKANDDDLPPLSHRSISARQALGTKPVSERRDSEREDVLAGKRKKHPPWTCNNKCLRAGVKSSDLPSNSNQP